MISGVLHWEQLVTGIQECSANPQFKSKENAKPTNEVVLWPMSSGLLIESGSRRCASFPGLHCSAAIVVPRCFCHSSLALAITSIFGRSVLVPIAELA